MSATEGQVLKWDGSEWSPEDDINTGAESIDELNDGKADVSSVFLGAGSVENDD
jgi:hypothetical protein